MTKTRHCQQFLRRWAATIRVRVGVGRNIRSVVGRERRPTPLRSRLSYALRVITVSRLHHQVFFLHGQLDFSIPRSRFRRVSQTVLIPQLFLDLIVDLFNRRLLRYFEEPAAGFFRETLQDFLAVRMLFLPPRWIPATPPTHASATKASAI